MIKFYLGVYGVFDKPFFILLLNLNYMKNWTIQITLQVADSWVEDGFNPAERLEQIEESIEALLPYAYDGEINATAKIINSPSEERVEDASLNAPLVVRKGLVPDMPNNIDKSVIDNTTISIWQEKGSLPAVKYLKESTGFTLREAKDYFDYITLLNN